MPASSRRNAPQEILQHDSQGEVTVVRAEKIHVAAGNLEFDDKFSVPEATVVSTDVASIGEHMEPIREDGLVRSKVGCDGLALARSAQVLIDQRPRSEG